MTALVLSAAFVIAAALFYRWAERHAADREAQR